MPKKKQLNNADYFLIANYVVREDKIIIWYTWVIVGFYELSDSEHESASRSKLRFFH